MIEELISDNDSGRMPGHTKRIGRELAMLYLFSGELNKDHLTVERSEFYAEAANLLKWRENRQLRKGREYADELLDLYVLHGPDVDERIKRQSRNWEWDRISLVDKNIMRIAVSEMLYMGEVPPVVSINEAVEIAMDYSGEHSGNFINGVLNAVKDQLSRPAREAVDNL